MEKRNQSIEVLTYGLLEQLELKLYGKDTLGNYRQILKNLALYMRRVKYLYILLKSGRILLRITFLTMK